MSRPIDEAKRSLKALYDWWCAESGPPGYEQFYPIDLEQLVSLVGWQLKGVAMVGQSEDHSPIDAKTDFSCKTITLAYDENVPPGRINFSLAHELGHVVLHGEKGLATLLRTRPIRKEEATSRYRHPFEVEADRFAVELLMPSKAVRRQFEQVLSTPVVLVSSSAAKRICQNHHKGHNSEPLKRSEVARAIAIHSSESCQVSLVDFFKVTPEAMTHRLMELRLVLD